MKLILYALVALSALLAIAPHEAQAQVSGNVTTEQQPSVQPDTPHTDATRVDSTTMRVRPDQTVSDVLARDERLIIEGHVTNDVVAINCNVTILPGAEVGNYVNLIGGNLDNQAGASIRVVHQDPGLIPLLAGQFGQPRSSSESGTHAYRRQWPGAQFALCLLGLMAGLIMHLTTPRAAQRASEIVGAERGRSLVLGLLAALAMLVVLAFGALLLRSPIGLMLAPFVAAVAVAFVTVLVFGWLCGMAEVGSTLQRRFGRMRGGWLTRAAFGLSAFFAANLFLGGLSTGLGVISLTLEGAIALAGLGACLISGFGADPNWLSSRLRGEIGWFARSPRF